MDFYWIKTSRFIKTMFPRYIWDFTGKNDRTVYLTFDDGPTPEVTPWVLENLRKSEAKATFFCIGDNIERHPQIFKQLITEGHSIGNHTFDHVNGWQTNTKDYIQNVESCAGIIDRLHANYDKLFRPPYGKIKKAQANILIAQGYKIIMWDVLSADFDTTVTPERCLQNVLSNTQPGSIIIFHDSVKAFKNLEYALPETLKFLKRNGFKCEVIS